MMMKWIWPNDVCESPFTSDLFFHLKTNQAWISKFISNFTAQVWLRFSCMIVLCENSILWFIISCFLIFRYIGTGRLTLSTPVFYLIYVSSWWLWNYNQFVKKFSLSKLCTPWPDIIHNTLRKEEGFPNWIHHCQK